MDGECFCETFMLQIKKLDIFILKSFCLLFAGTFFICLFIFEMQFLWRYVDDLVGKGLTVDVLAQFFFYASLTLVPASLPLAVLLAFYFAHYFFLENTVQHWYQLADDLRRKFETGMQ